jgi:hypothetical protein
MVAPKTARAARSRDADSDPQKIERLPGALDFEFTFSALELQTKKIAKRFGLPLALAGTVADLHFGEVR